MKPQGMRLNVNSILRRLIVTFLSEKTLCGPNFYEKHLITRKRLIKPNSVWAQSYQAYLLWPDTIGALDQPCEDAGGLSPEVV
jgi:hypothetical protein